MHFRNLAIFLLSTTALAQTSTDCNPTEKTCPSDEGLSSSTYSVDFTQGSSDDWNITYGSVDYSTDSGAAFTITASGDAPTMQTNFYIFFGVISVYMRAAPGTGIVSCAILESDDLDEIDWEWLGGSVNEVQTNYFGKGNTTSYDRGTYEDVTDSQGTTHNYTIEWTSDYTTWYIDGTAVRTLNYEDALDGKNYPQTPMRVKLGLWAGGDSDSEGTVTWAGGETDYDDGPFTMYVEKVEITNYNPGSSYTYSDLTGDWTSIAIGDADDSSSEGSSSSSSGSSSSTAVSSTIAASSTSATSSSPASSSTGGFGTAVAQSASTTTSSASNTTSSSTSTGTSSLVQSISAASNFKSLEVNDMYLVVALGLFALGYLA
ncbi:concanavalin A-like lectin/glucanase domain-containing protein [Bisporella sp. PMI_857]|nr:concanavalin A-like lectin/glucanase domain-containing protein [Bisporella sp. PMI_857]